jgi:ATP-dependent RNA helicase RhlE
MFLTDPATVSVSPVSSTAENVEQRVYFLLKRVKKETYYTT